MDDLSILEADSIEAASESESASFSLPEPDFTGSLDYIDSLASRRSLSISRRDIRGIATALTSFDYLYPGLSPAAKSLAVTSPTDVGFRFSSDFRSVGDARRYDPESSVRPPRALVRSASRVVNTRSSPRNFPPGWRNPLDPDRDPRDIERALSDAERRIRRTPFKFERPNQVVICLKRKIRKHVFHAFHLAGKHGFKKPRKSFWSEVLC